MVSRMLYTLRTMNPWHFLWVTVLLAEIFTAILNTINSYAWWGGISYDLLAIGTIDALVVSLIVAPIIIHFLQSTMRLAAANERLQGVLQERERTEEQLRYLSARLESVREEERTRIAREIHDELGQTLTALKFSASWLERRMPPGQDEMLRKVRAMEGLIDSTIHSVRRINMELRPGILDDLGLAAAIRWQAGEFQNNTGIACEVYCEPPDLTLDRERSTALFRMVQELLTNVARHAHATTVAVRLELEDNSVLLEVEDNGIGISENKVSDVMSSGLMGIQERARAFGGAVETEGVPDQGTIVTVIIPLDGVVSA